MKIELIWLVWLEFWFTYFFHIHYCVEYKVHMRVLFIWFSVMHDAVAFDRNFHSDTVLRWGKLSHHVFCVKKIILTTSLNDLLKVKDKSSVVNCNWDESEEYLSTFSYRIVCLFVLCYLVITYNNDSRIRIGCPPSFFLLRHHLLVSFTIFFSCKTLMETQTLIFQCIYIQYIYTQRQINKHSLVWLYIYDVSAFEC